MNIEPKKAATQAVYFFVLCSVISFGGASIFLPDKGLPGSSEQIKKYFPHMLMILLSGPVVSGIILTISNRGLKGLREVLSGILKVRIELKWYLLALFIIPFVVLTTLLTLSTFSSEFLPEILTADDKSIILISGLLIGVFGGLLEELGWTGFLTTQLRSKCSSIGTGQIIGIYWGIWHIPMAWASGDSEGEFSPKIVLTAFALLHHWTTSM